MPRHRPRQLPQWIGQDIRQHQVERAAAAQSPAPRSRWRGSACTRCPVPFSRAFSRATLTEGASMSLASTLTVQRLGGGDRQHAGAGAEIEHAPRLAVPSGHDRAATGSRAWCRDGRCRTPAPPRSRCRACLAARGRGRGRRARRNARPGPGTRSSRLALTQSLASTVSNAMVLAISAARGAGNQFPHHRLVGGFREMQGDIPAPVRPLECRDRGLALEENLGEDVDHAFGGLFVANGKAGAVGGGSDGGGHLRGLAAAFSIKFKE